VTKVGLFCCVLAMVVCPHSVMANDDVEIEKKLKTVSVDCDSGHKNDTITRALTKHPGKPLRIEFEGVCHEGVVLERDNVTIVGVTPGAAIVGPPDGYRVDGLKVLNSRNIVLQDFEVTSEASTGIRIQLSSPVTIERLVAFGSRTGGSIERSHVDVRDCEFRDNANFGLSIWQDSMVLVGGAFLNTLENSVGLVVSESTVDLMRDVGQFDHTVRSENNRNGVSVQKNAEVKLLNVVASDNDEGGITVTGGGRLWPARTTQVMNNGGFGVWLSGQASMSFVGEVSNNAGIGVWAGAQSDLTMNWSHVQGNGQGVLVDEEAHIAIWESTVAGSTSGPEIQLHGGSALFNGIVTDGDGNVDVALEFGSKATFGGASQVTNVSCDGTVLVEGDVACPAAIQKRSPRQIGRFERRAPPVWGMN
jgi:hypothetical protein